MIRRLAFLALALLALWLWLRRKPQSVGAAAADRSRASGAGPDMVRDRVCDTFLPRASALVVRDGEQTLYFCGPACRERYLARKSEVSP